MGAMDSSESSLQDPSSCSSCNKTKGQARRIFEGVCASICDECLANCDEIARSIEKAAADMETREVEANTDTYEVQTDPIWRAVANEEYAVWAAKSYEDLRTVLSAVGCVCYDRDEAGNSYQVEVQLLENRPDYVHVMFAVCSPQGWAAPTIQTSFIRYADGRLDA
jgi:hypothetical protein